MRRSLFLLCAIVAGTAAHAQFTGLLSDFNVSLGGSNFTGPVSGSAFGDLQPGGGGAGHTAAAAATGVVGNVSYTIWDGYGAHGNAGVGSHHDLRDFGGQQFDVKALYMTNDLTYLYIGIVTGMNPLGVADPYGRPRTYHVGDIALNPHWGSATADFGVLLPTAAPGASGSTSVVQGGNWHTPDADVGFGPPAYANYKDGGLFSGILADYKYSQLYDGGNPVQYADPTTSSNAPIYLIEARVKFADLGLTFGQTVGASFAVSCNNDYLGGEHVLVTPEPSTYASMASGLLALGAAAVRRRRRV